MTSGASSLLHVELLSSTTSVRGAAPQVLREVQIMKISRCLVLIYFFTRASEVKGLYSRSGAVRATLLAIRSVGLHVAASQISVASRRLTELVGFRRRRTGVREAVPEGLHRFRLDFIGNHVARTAPLRANWLRVPIW